MGTTENTAIAAERGILSSILNGQPVGLFWQNSLSANLFHDKRHQVIFYSIQQVDSEGTTPDILLVQSALTKSSQLETAGGQEYLQSLTVPISTASQFDAYVELIRNNRMKHALIEMGERLISMGNCPTEDATNDWETAIHDMNKTQASFYVKSTPNIKHSVSEFLDELNIRQNGDNNPDLVSTGFELLDNEFGGLGNGELIIVGARPTMGKTGFALSMLAHLLMKEKTPVAWFSLEISTQQLIKRLVSMLAHVQSPKIQSGNLDKDDYAKVCDAIVKLKAAPLHVIDDPGIQIHRLLLLARKLHEMQGIKMIVVDYLQLMGSDKRNRNESRELQISNMCRALKRLARELNIPVVVLSQLSRAVETRGGDKKPILSDLRESGAIEQDADKVLFLYRAEYYGLDYDAEGKKTKNTAEVIVAKNRFGPVGTINLEFVPDFSKFKDFDEQTGELRPNDIPIADEQLRQKFKRVFLQQDEDDLDTPF